MTTIDCCCQIELHLKNYILKSDVGMKGLTFVMSAQYMLKYPLKAASAVPAGAHFTGYYNSQ